MTTLLPHHIDYGLFASTFSIIFLSEIPDKTALATLLLAAHNRPWAVFLGVAAAFVIQSAVAVLCGSLLSLFPARYVRFGAGIMFLVFALAMWIRSQPNAPEKSEQSKPSFWKMVGLSFMVIFIAEWGDLTQLATAALSAKYPNPVIILSAAILALWSVSGIAIIIGHRLKHVIAPKVFQRIAAVVFVIIGILILCGVELRASP